jgi:hypothetical protein
LTEFATLFAKNKKEEYLERRHQQSRGVYEYPHRIPSAAPIRNHRSRTHSAHEPRNAVPASSRYMNRDGTRCRVGVRRLADETGLNKSTVAQHRAAAIQQGWLIPMSRRPGQGCAELLPAAPDALAVNENGVVTGEAGQSDAPDLQASGTSESTVRNHAENRPAIPDRSSIPIKPIQKRLETLRKRGIVQGRNPPVTRKTLQEYLRDWMRRDPSVPKYLPIGDAETLKVLAPIPLRVFNYEELIEILVDESLAERSATTRPTDINRREE